MSVKLVKKEIILLAVLILLIFLHYTKILAPLENLISKGLIPLQEKTVLLGLKINNFLTLTRPAQEKLDLIEENRVLKGKIHELLRENTRLKIFEEENKVLRTELNFLEDKNYDFVVARVIGRDAQNNLNSLILNKGEKNGLQKGLPVIAQEGLLVGKIIKTEGNTSQVLLLTDSQSKVAAVVQARNAPGLVEGEYGLSLKMTFIPRDKTLQKNDLVVTSGLENNIPPGLLIGEIEEVTTETDDLFQSAFLKPFVLTQDLSMVSILVTDPLE